jgi:hypothetical protein
MNAWNPVLQMTRKSLLIDAARRHSIRSIGVCFNHSWRTFSVLRKWAKWHFWQVTEAILRMSSSCNTIRTILTDYLLQRGYKNMEKELRRTFSLEYFSSARVRTANGGPPNRVLSTKWPTQKRGPISTPDGSYTRCLFWDGITYFPFIMEHFLCRWSSYVPRLTLRRTSFAMIWLALFMPLPYRKLLSLYCA